MDSESIILAELSTIKSELRDTRDRVITVQEQIRPFAAFELRLAALERWRWVIYGAAGATTVSVGTTFFNVIRGTS